MKLGSVCFYSNNIAKVVDFYTKVFGLEVDYLREDEFVRFRFENDVTLSIKKAVGKREIPGAQTFFVDSENAGGDFEKYKNMGV